CTMLLYCSSVPNRGSISKLMRSKFPSTEGVWLVPLMPPDSFIGPVWTPWMPIFWKALHSLSSASVVSTDASGEAGTVDAGYAVNHTEARAETAGGWGTP